MEWKIRMYRIKVYWMKNSYVQNKGILNEKFVAVKLDILNGKFHCTKCTSVYISIYKNTFYYALL